MEKAKQLFHVVRVNHDARDTFAHEDLCAAKDMTQADLGDCLESTLVYASDPGAARVEADKRGTRWETL